MIVKSKIEILNGSANYCKSWIWKAMHYESDRINFTVSKDCIKQLTMLTTWIAQQIALHIKYGKTLSS